MLIKAVVLENFRAYKKRTIIPISQLTGLIGRNDAGKSSILEALDIFFESGTVKIEPGDASKGGNPKQVCIGVVFGDLPAQLVLDSDAPTTLQNEYLLNAGGDLEIFKVFNCENQTPKAKIFASAIHPTAKDAAEVLQKTQKELRALVKARGLENNCNQAENPSMRIAIYQSIGDLQLKPHDVPLNDENGKEIWKNLQTYMPIFALFQADRPSKDQDPEVQNPMKVAIEQALETLERQLEDITNQVQQRAQETADRTVAKLNETYPNLASTLRPNFKRPSWKTVFKLDLEADDGIPLNKRGSGVRRLVLLSFFQAEAEKRRNDAEAGNAPKRRVVYAIEEPETSQHPDSQRQIIEALRVLAGGGDQVILTTHVPALAGLIPLESLRFVDRDPQSQGIRVRSGDDDGEVYGEIADALGVLPDPVTKTGVKVAVLVEGKNDIDALRSFISVLAAAGEIAAIEEAEIFWAIGGGDSTLMDWVERRYLDKLDVPQVMLQDSDRTASGLPVKPAKVQWLTEMNGRPKVRAFLTNKRSMDNYFHPDVLSRVTNGALALPASIDVDFVKISAELSNRLTAARANAKMTGFNFAPTDHEGRRITKTDDSACKQIIACCLIKNMTTDELRAIATYDDNGTKRHEVREWIDAIRSHL